MASQLAALRERVAGAGLWVAPEDECVDEGYSGSTLLRPALERLRDAVAAGVLDEARVLAPDRLARRYAHRVLLVEEFSRAGMEPLHASLERLRADVERLLELEAGSAQPMRLGGSPLTVDAAAPRARIATFTAGFGVPELEFVPGAVVLNDALLDWCPDHGAPLDWPMLGDTVSLLRAERCRWRPARGSRLDGWGDRVVDTSVPWRAHELAAVLRTCAMACHGPHMPNPETPWGALERMWMMAERLAGELIDAVGELEQRAKVRPIHGPKDTA